jgi:hypothetical protein
MFTISLTLIEIGPSIQSWQIILVKFTESITTSLMSVNCKRLNTGSSGAKEGIEANSISSINELEKIADCAG